MFRAELANTLNYLDKAYHGSMDCLDRYIDIKTLLGGYNRADCLLDDIERELVIGYYVLGHTHSELANHYGMSRQAVSKKLEKAIEVLKDEYKD